MTPLKRFGAAVIVTSMNRKAGFYGIHRIVTSVVFLIAALTLMLTARIFDNKYTINSSPASNGVLTFSSQITYLTNGWELYENALLEPSVFATPQTPNRYVNIGYDSDGLNTQFTSSTYRLTAVLPNSPNVYTLELPEIFSSYKLWINGQLLRQNENPGRLTGGVINGYKPFIRTGSVSFEASGIAEIVIAASNYSHYTNRLRYAPAFGFQRDMDTLFGIRIIMRVIIIGIPLLTSIAFIMFALFQKDRALAHFAVICLSFGGYMSYTLISGIGFSTVWLVYLFTDACFCILLLSLTHLILNITKAHKRFTILITVIFSLTLISRILSAFGLACALYPFMYNAYRLVVLFCIIGTTISAAIKRHSAFVPLVCGIVLYSAGTIIDSFSGDFDPVLFGSGTEQAFVFLSAVFSFMLFRRVLDIYRENAQYAAHMEEIMMQQTQNLNAANDHLNHILATRKRFMSDISHDIKSPLTAIGGFVELLTSGIVTDESESIQIMQNISDKVSELAKRVDKLSVLSKLDEDMPNFRIQLISGFLDGIIRSYRAVATSSPKHFSINHYGIDASVNMDSEKLKVAIENILNNAIRFMPPDGRIDILTEVADKHLQIHIFDNGCGIQPVYLPYVFDRFWSIDPRHTGIGLAITKRIIEEHGGIITVESEPNVGTTFTILLPLA